MYKTSHIKKAQRLAGGFTLVEIMIVVAIIGIIIAIAVPAWLRQRENSRGSACQENLAKIHDSKEVYAAEFDLINGAACDISDLINPPDATATGQGYLRRTPFCPAGGTYSTNVIGTDPTCSIGTTNSPFEPHVVTR